jgi:hypothetical protein
VNLAVKIKFPKVVKRKVTLAPEPRITSVGPNVVRQGSVTGLTLAGTFLQDGAPPVLFATAPADDDGDALLAPTATDYDGAPLVDPISAAITFAGATLEIDADDAASFGQRDLVYRPHPLLGEPFRLPNAFTVRAPVPAVTAVDPATVLQEESGTTLTLTGTGFRTGGLVSISGTGVSVGSTTVDSDTTATVPISVTAGATVGTRDVSFVQPSAGGGDTGTGSGLLQVNHPVPTVVSAAPLVVRQSQSGVTLTVTGTGFRTGGVLSISGTGITAGSTTVSNATTASCSLTVAANATLGSRNVTYTQPAAGGGAAATGTGVFSVEYPTPTVTSCTPDFLRQLQSNGTLTVGGTGFRSGGALSLSGTGLTVGSTTVDSDTQATVTVSVDEFATVGARTLTFTQDVAGGGASGGSSALLGIRNPVPTMSDSTPASVTQGASGVTITLTGTRFRDGGAVSAGSGIAVTGNTRNSDNEFVATLGVDAQATLGLHDVTYTQPAAGGGDTVTRSGVLQVNAPTPTVGSVSSTKFVKQGDSAVSRSLSGTNFRSGGALTVSGSGVTLGSVTVASATQVDFTVTVTSNAAAGDRDLTWTQPLAGGGASATLVAGLTVNFPDPTVTSVAPLQIERSASGLTMTVTGTNFRTGGTIGISGTGVTLTSPAFVNDTTYTVTYSVDAAATLGNRDVTYTHALGGGGASHTKTSAVEVIPLGPELTSLAPDEWIPGATRFRCVATGVNFNAGTAVTLSGSGVTVHSTTFDSSTKLTLELSVDSAAALGSRDVTVTPGAGGGPPRTFTGAARVAAAAPAPASFSLATLGQGASNIAVTILGANFRSGDAVTASGSGVTFSSVTFVNAGKITANVSATGGAATGLRDVVVTHSAGDGGLAGTHASAFTVTAAAPSISAVNPAAAGRTGSGGATRQVPITLTGTNFMTGATLAVTKSGGSGVSVVASSESVVSATQMTATLSVTGAATTGTWDLQVVNPSSLGNSGSSGNGLLDVKSETTLCVNRVVASSGAAFGGERVTVEGSGFVTGATVDFGSVTSFGNLFLDQNTIVTTVPTPTSVSTSGPTAVNVKVTNPSTANATLAPGYSYAKHDSFIIRRTFPKDATSGVPQNLTSAVFALSAPANTSTAPYGTTRGTNCFWFEGGSTFVSGGLRGFGPGGRTIVLSRTGGGSLPIAASGQYFLELPTALLSAGGVALTPTRSSGGFFDQRNFTLAASGTDSTAPTVSSISPSSSASGVGRGTRVTVVFSEELDPLTVNATNITFKQGASTVTADLRLSEDLKTVTILPQAMLAASTTYTTAVTASVKDLYGNAFSAVSHTFTTGSATDAVAPVVDSVTIESIPSDMDGSGTYVAGVDTNPNGTAGTAGSATAFDLYLPRSGWLVEVAYSDDLVGIDESTFSAKASVAVAGNSANAELASNFTVTQTGASWRIPSTGFAAGDDATFTFTVKDRSGNGATSKVVTIDVLDKDSTATFGGDHDPFDSRKTWVIRADLDAYTATFATQTGPNKRGATTTVASNGIPDLDEALRLVGLNSGSMTTAAAATVNGSETGTNAVVKRLFLARLRESLRERFMISEDGVYGADSVDVEFLLPGEQGSLGSLPTFSTANSFNSAKPFSEMSIGGTLFAEASPYDIAGTLGQAWNDPRNLSQEANLNDGVGVNISGTNFVTGIYLMSMLKSVVNHSTTGSVYGARVSAKFVAIHGGTPVGEDALDDDVLAGTFDRTSGGNSGAQNARYDAILDAVEITALYASSVMAHEIGHSTGLVPDSGPKTGFFGNAHRLNTFTEATLVNRNTSAHMDCLGNDVMGPTGAVEKGIATGTEFQRFSPLDLAYLRNRLIFDEGK